MLGVVTHDEKVLVPMMSDPDSRYLAWISLMIWGCVMDSMSLFPLTKTW